MAASSKTLIKVTDVDVQLNNNILLKDVNIDIPKNNLIAIVGPDKQAKTAFLRLFNRIDEYKRGYKRTGQIKFNNQKIKKIPPAKLRQAIGIILAQPTIFPGSILDNLLFGLKIHRLPVDKIDDQIQDVLEEVGLWEKVRSKLQSNPKNLTKSEQQRLNIARTLMLQPDVILMETPTDELQEIARSSFESLLFQLRKKHTILFIASDIQQAGRVSDKMAFFHNTRLLAFSNTQSIFIKPPNKIIENFITGRFE